MQLENRSQLQKDYLCAKLTIPQVAERNGCCVATVYARAREHGWKCDGRVRGRKKGCFYKSHTIATKLEIVHKVVQPTEPSTGPPRRFRHLFRADAPSEFSVSPASSGFDSDSELGQLNKRLTAEHQRQTAERERLESLEKARELEQVNK